MNATTTMLDLEWFLGLGWTGVGVPGVENGPVPSAAVLPPEVPAPGLEPGVDPWMDPWAPEPFRPRIGGRDRIGCREGARG